MKKTFILLLIFISLLATAQIVFASSGNITSYYDQINDRWFGNGTSSTFLNGYISHIPGYNNSYWEDSNTYFSITNTSSYQQYMGYQTQVDTNILYPLYYYSTSSSPTVDEDRLNDDWNWKSASTLIRTTTFYQDANETNDLYVQYEWRTIGDYYWGEYDNSSYTGAWAGLGRVVSPTQLYPDYAFTPINLKSN